MIEIECPKTNCHGIMRRTDYPGIVECRICGVQGVVQ